MGYTGNNDIFVADVRLSTEFFNSTIDNWFNNVRLNINYAASHVLQKQYI